MGSCITASAYREGASIRADAVTDAARIKQAAAAAEFALSAADTVKNMSRLSAIASRGIALEEQQQQRLKDIYWPAEDTFFEEFRKANSWESQSVLAKRYAGQMWASIASGFAKQLKALEINKLRYSGIAHVRAFQELLVARAAAKANVITLADRIAFAEVEAFKDRDFDRRKAALAMRQGLLGQAAALMSAAANGLASAGQESFSRANAALGLIGYEQERIRSLGDEPRAARSSNLTESMVTSNTQPSDYDIIDKGTFESDSMDSQSDASFGDMGSLSSFNGVNYNQTVDEATAMEGRDFARGGKVSIASYEIPVKGGSGSVTIPKITIDLEQADLVAVDNYASDMVQTGPDNLPGNTGGGNPTVSYGSV